MAVLQGPLRSRGSGSRAALLLLPFALAAVFVLQSHNTLHIHIPHSTVRMPEGDLLARPGTEHALAVPRRQLSAEAWAGFAPAIVADGVTQVVELLSESEKKELHELCGRCLYDQLDTAIQYGNSHKVFVATGDIPFMWIRDSAVQLGALLPRVSKRPSLRLLVEGAVRTQAFFIVQDPYANSYNINWRKATSLNKDERLIGRGGWIATRNYELDSGAYFLHMLWNLYSLPGYARTALLAEAVVYEAASLLVDIWTIEQRHEELSQYRYSELPRNGRGPLSNYTGMSWSGFRPSDDPQKYGYNVPVNMYAQAALERALELNYIIWKSSDFEKRARALADSIRQGIESWGIVEVEEGVKVYAYEVDGLGNVLADFDDANVPSLLSIPLLGYDYDKKIYETTRERILSSKNPYFFSGQFSGIGSPHTPTRMVWPLALSVQALTSPSPKERADILRTLLKLQCGNGLMHESVHVDNLSSCTRQWFGWANAMLVALVEASTGMDCSVSAERQRLARIQEREKSDTSARAQNGDGDDPLYFETMEATARFDSQEVITPSWVGRRREE